MNNTLAEKGKINWGTVIKIAGLFVSWCVGSGYVTGQECLQYFVGYGVWGFAVIAIAMLLHLFLNYSFFSLGYEKQYTNPLEIFEFYVGKKFAKVFQILSVGLMASAPIVMISGFGAAINQYFGIPAWVGNIILGGLMLVTILLGLKGLVNAMGSIGPLIVVVAIGTGLIYLLSHMSGGSVAYGMELAPTLPINKIAPLWIMSAYYYVCPLHSAPYLAAAATTCKSKKEAVYGGVLGVICYCLIIVVMVLACFSDIEVISQQLLPNLYMANSISSVLGLVFVLLVFLGIYSSATPCLFTICKSFWQEKTVKYNMFAVIFCVAATAISLTLPFDQLFGIIYGVFGFAGGFLILCMIVKYVRLKFFPQPAKEEAA